jgi:hypothetical protein
MVIGGERVFGAAQSFNQDSKNRSLALSLTEPIRAREAATMHITGTLFAGRFVLYSNANVVTRLDTVL